MEDLGNEENATPIEEVVSEEVVEESHQEETEDTGGEEIVGDVGATTEEPEYEPNYSFRAGEEEYEMDERLRALITDKESEEYVRELAERATGLETLKQQRNEWRTEKSQFEGIESQRQGAVQTLQNHVKNNEWEPFQKTWDISDDQILNRAVQIMQVREMPEQEQQAYYGNLQAREQNQQLQQQNNQLQNQQNEMATNQRSWELNQTLGSEHFSSTAQAFDERAGHQGAFRDEIIRRGQYYAQVQGKDVPPHVLAQELSMYVQHTVPQGQANQQQKVVVSRKPTLPNIRGGSTSPVKGGITSIADIKAKAAEFAIG